MKKKIVTILLVVIGIFIVFVAFNLSNKQTVTVTEKNQPTSEGQPDGGTFIEIQEERTESIEAELPKDISEEQVQQIIHNMSHQKIRAEDKWGFTPLTLERVERLLEVVNANQYEQADLYLDILNRWKEADFSQADRDHNAIWRLQNGTIGEATGLLTIEEEQELIKKNFKVKDMGKEE
ncbi:hypothetical protein JMM81_11975 [Bacillus sp. V3B]|uniref:DUF6241 domain-containing protein n=1 Tax=Bacillus sp. V3B TaxID=2804915 RepID=UPI002109ADD3|nr:DUF6241 domain-containing protein [Bacillus sp. V3B]MCQ6275676.1 hypothetical protein [Bacillus sp. V3B]